jgi:hypothetical protein
VYLHTVALAAWSSGIVSLSHRRDWRNGSWDRIPPGYRVVDKKRVPKVSKFSWFAIYIFFHVRHIHVHLVNTWDNLNHVMQIRLPILIFKLIFYVLLQRMLQFKVIFVPEFLILMSILQRAQLLTQLLSLLGSSDWCRYAGLLLPQLTGIDDKRKKTYVGEKWLFRKVSDRKLKKKFPKKNVEIKWSRCPPTKRQRFFQHTFRVVNVTVASSLTSRNSNKAVSFRVILPTYDDSSSKANSFEKYSANYVRWCFI